MTRSARPLGERYPTSGSVAVLVAVGDATELVVVFEVVVGVVAVLCVVFGVVGVVSVVVGFEVVVVVVGTGSGGPLGRSM